MITKAEASNWVIKRDQSHISNYLNRIDTSIRSNWEGKRLAIDTGVIVIPPHIVAAIQTTMEKAGWTFDYQKGDSDQRDGEWNGAFIIS